MKARFPWFPCKNDDKIWQAADERLNVDETSGIFVSLSLSVELSHEFLSAETPWGTSEGFEVWRHSFVDETKDDEEITPLDDCVPTAKGSVPRKKSSNLMAGPMENVDFDNVNDADVPDDEYDSSVDGASHVDEMEIDDEPSGDASKWNRRKRVSEGQLNDELGYGQKPRKRSRTD